MLRDLSYENADIRIGNGHEGWNEKSPFDAIIVTAIPPTVPQSLLNQLKVGGRIIIPLGETRQRLVIIRSTANGYERENSLLVAFVLMTGKPKKRRKPTSFRRTSYQLLRSSSQYLFRLSVSPNVFVTEASSEIGSW